MSIIAILAERNEAVGEFDRYTDDQLTWILQKRMEQMQAIKEEASRIVVELERRGEL